VYLLFYDFSVGPCVHTHCVRNSLFLPGSACFHLSLYSPDGNEIKNENCKKNNECEIVGVYGDVQRVKILYNKKDSALIQMAEPHQAYLGEFFKVIFLNVIF
jgi:hypothetical protein